MGFGVVLSDGKQDTQNYIVWKKEKKIHIKKKDSNMKTEKHTVTESMS